MTVEHRRVTVWDRARALRHAGLGADRIWRTLFREGWYPLPLARTIEVRYTDEGWPVAAGANRNRHYAEELTADERWLGSLKRCHACYASGTGATCPNRHPFPLGVDTGPGRAQAAADLTP